MNKLTWKDFWMALFGVSEADEPDSRYPMYRINEIVGEHRTTRVQQIKVNKYAEWVDTIDVDIACDDRMYREALRSLNRKLS